MSAAPAPYCSALARAERRQAQIVRAAPHRAHQQAQAAAAAGGETRGWFGCAWGGTGHVQKITSTVQDHRRVGRALHRKMPVHHGIAEHAPDVAFHHAAEAVVARADVHADVVDLVLERLQGVAAVDPVIEHRLELAAVGPAFGVGRDAGHFVMRAVLGPQLDADAVQRVVRKIFAAHGVAALDRLDEFFRRGRQVRNHHLPAAPEFPHRAREHHACGRTWRRRACIRSAAAPETVRACAAAGTRLRRASTAAARSGRARAARNRARRGRAGALASSP